MPKNTFDNLYQEYVVDGEPIFAELWRRLAPVRKLCLDIDDAKDKGDLEAVDRLLGRDRLN